MNKAELIQKYKAILAAHAIDPNDAVVILGGSLLVRDVKVNCSNLDIVVGEIQWQYFKESIVVDPTLGMLEDNGNAAYESIDLGNSVKIIAMLVEPSNIEVVDGVAIQTLEACRNQMAMINNPKHGYLIEPFSDEITVDFSKYDIPAVTP